MPRFSIRSWLKSRRDGQSISASDIRLCHPCHQFTFDILNQIFPSERWSKKQPNNHFYFVHSQLTIRHQQAESDCKLCKLILSFAEDRAAERATSFQPGPVTIRADITDPDYFWVEIPVEGEFIMASRLEFFPTEHTDCANLSPSAKVLKPSQTARVVDHPAEKNAFELVRNWLFECHQTHIECGRPQQSFSPRRLLDVGLADGSKPVRLREDMIGNFQYTALSHCWGQNRAGITTKANLFCRKQQISWADLPATFRDAIVITRNIGIPYLWIDSLCIVQDSTQDWNQNCLEMSSIYSNSTITIGALWGQSSQAGIFCNRKTKYPGNVFQEEIISISSSSESDGTNDCCTIGVRVAPWDFDYALNASKLDKRGWVFQERILSKATLYYWTSEMYWECRACKASESRPKLIPHGDGYLKGILHQMQRDGITQHPGGQYLAWYLLVENYTRKEFTYPSDKYPAILGLVTEFRKRFSVTDVSGVWAEDLHRGLTWQRWVCDTRRPLKAIGYPEAPSWSWLGVEFPVLFAWIPKAGDMTSFYPTEREPNVSDADIVKIGRPVTASGRPKSKNYCQIYADIVQVSCEVLQPLKAQKFRNWSVMRLRKTKEEAGPELLFVPDWDFDVIDHAYCARIAVWKDAHDTWGWQGFQDGPQPVFAYYLVIQREKDIRVIRGPMDLGAFSRIGVGAAPVVEVDSFFTHSSRRLIKLL